MNDIESTCPYCGVGCGLTVTPRNESTLILGSSEHPANFGRLCSKGSALAQTIHSEQIRLTAPQLSSQEVSWEEATTTIAERILSSIAEHGKDSVAFYLSGQLLTEDYYVANKLMKGFIGTANVDTNSRLCMSSAVTAYKRAFGADAVPCCYEDLEVADLIVLVGSNAAWTHPVLYQRMRTAKERNPQLRIVLIDPRKTVSCDISDMHLQLRPSSDGFLFQGLLNYLVNNNEVNQTYIEQHTEGFINASQMAERYDLATTASMTQLDPHQLIEFYQLFAKTTKAVSFYSQGINQSATGSDKCNAIINCHLATGKIGYAGAGPFSITGQPNAMGGREVGGLATMLAAHMDFAEDDIARVKRFWKSPSMASEPGLKAVDLFEAVHQGKIKVLWIMATNPAVSLPDSDYIREALERCETVIVSDVTQTDTTGYADILLPAMAWGEKDGSVTNSERCISRQRSFTSGPEMAKPDWWILTEVAKKMGYEDAFDYKTAHDVFIEHASLSGFENTGETRRCFDISALSCLSQTEYETFKPIQWPIMDNAPNGTKRLFEDGLFFTKSKKAQFISALPSLARALKDVQKLEASQPEANNTLYLLNSGRLRDQWHTMTRTANAASLTLHDEAPLVQIHPSDAKFHCVESGDFIKLSNQHGAAVLCVDVNDAVMPGQLFAPIHWSDQFATGAVVNRLFPQVTDPFSGQPELKSCSVSLQKFEARYWAKVVTKHSLSRQALFSYWSSCKASSSYVTLVASNQPIDYHALLQDPQSNESLKSASLIGYDNPLTGITVGVCTEPNGLIGALYFQSRSAKKLPSALWLTDTMQDSSQLGRVLRGESGSSDSLVCACFGTSRKAIEQVSEGEMMTQVELAELLGCGSKCGSCIPEINALIKDASR